VKKIFTAIFAFACYSGAFAQENVIHTHFPVTNITLDRSHATLNRGDTLQLVATVLPAHATNKNTTWLSSDTTIVTVSNTGAVTARISGTAIITVKTAEGNFTATCEVTVVALPLGTASFDSRGHNVVIQGTGENAHIRQIWSGAVTATACQKTTFRGGSSPNFIADCRSNPGFPGDLFSWYAVVRFANQLCPYPWRVPTVQDFRDLDVALGGVWGTRSPSDKNAQFIRDNYIALWGGALGGNSRSGGVLGVQGSLGWYWSQTESSATHAHNLVFNRDGNIHLSNRSPKNMGMTLRCIRDN